MRFRSSATPPKPTTSLTPNPPKKLMLTSLLFQWRPTHLLYLPRLSILNPQVPPKQALSNSEPHVPTVVPAQANTAVSTVPSIESESLLDIAPLQSNE
ncbi:hypothetical protein DSO57_1039406 [Entomophthora muscae]|uniref:Uncharacterized protein n=1 Tax=Entomophthora muscae TaxID=34485 RepID=A0ACC2RPB6_9FUNG|nr:hypothetical protein DSO57_1039406 [Entomophthora muscae]